MTMTQFKPFNPILGETFQASIGKSTNLYMEQTSHHPPIYNFLIIGNKFRLYGFEEPKASTGANNVVAKSFGKYVLELGNDTIYEFSSPELNVSGTIMGDRAFAIKGKIFITDKKNDYVSITEFNPDERGFFSKVFSKSDAFPDYFKSFITRISQCNYSESNGYEPKSNHTELIKLNGHWQSQIEYDDRVIYDRTKIEYSKLLRMVYTLPSDCTLRSDLVALRDKNEKLAQTEKTRLEEIQRNDRKLRLKFKKSNH